MLLQPVLRAPSCGAHRIGLSSIRAFSSTPTSLLSRRLPHQAFRTSQSQSRTATIPLRRHPLLFTLTAASALSLPYLTNRTTVSNDSSPDFSTSAYSHGRDAKVPITKDGGINPRAIRQISMGSILGLGLGVVVSAFSRMLVLVLGVGIVLSQYAARRGYNIIPVEKVQRYVKGVNLRSAINDNAAFKISFGLMFALTAFGEF